MRKCWRFVLSLSVLVALLFSGCAKDNPPDSGAESTDAESASETGTVEELPDPLRLVSDGKSDYVIIYPEGASSNVMRAVRNLQSQIKDYTGAALEAQDDYLKKGQTGGTYEILIGSTNREESQGQLSGMRSGEYCVTMVGSKLVLLGTSDIATGNAVDYFVDKILKKAEGLGPGTTGGTLVFSYDLCYRREVQTNIRSLTVGGVPVSDFRLVVPADSALESYLARMLQRHLSLYAGYDLALVTDAEEAGAHEIRIGITARTTAQAEAGKATVRVTDSGDMEIVWDSDAGLVAAYRLLSDTVFTNLKAEIALSAGEQWSAAETAPENVAKTGEMRIMYHNVWGYINADGSNPVSMRPDLALSVYRTYQPDVLCLQECSSVYRDGGTALFAWLNAYYGEIVYADQGGIGNPIFYSKAQFEVVDSGYAKSRNGDKGTTWVVLRRLSDGVIFAVTNSHFAANTNAGDDPVKGNEYRVQDAQAMAQAVQKILSQYGNITVFSGGDFNSDVGSDPYAALTGAGLKNIRSYAELCTTVSPYNSTFAYHEAYDLYLLQGKVSTDAQWAIDHVMLSGTLPQVHLYTVADDPLACTASDHLPHFADVTLQTPPPAFEEGDPNDLTTVDFADLFQ